jgi:NAD(P)-dependent dehydrogenase (short-subunit alcohol dehydrogenase family)
LPQGRNEDYVETRKEESLRDVGSITRHSPPLVSLGSRFNITGQNNATDHDSKCRRLPHLTERGSIVNIASVQGHIAVPNNSAYVASKHGVVGLTKTASEDHVADGIRVNAICPGYIMTPMNGTNENWEKDIWMVKRDVPQQRWGHPEEIAQSVLFLCGGKSTYISGTSLLVDGGMTER